MLEIRRCSRGRRRNEKYGYDGMEELEGLFACGSGAFFSIE